MKKLSFFHTRPFCNCLSFLMRSVFYMRKDIPVLFAVKHSTFFVVLLKYPPQKVQNHAPFETVRKSL